ncbi:hypothetical protein [Siphonobacter sp. SORGH_AS_1065]|uniref:hypothetical protein n=1 Tax=Siphonobacter sp. SORGH_AS_1065 TaxID=3041795 RepID=UPI002784AD2C|nr:hypothetical protein [Siphonobacter sp. SORGH_AS_1065]MDQ1089701.1 mRNA-degrading endonuclease YafQ of YafQ-DinJ toxin-antitoxin module [Siphonobacter sp. SORGH_AS_1065]
MELREELLVQIGSYLNNQMPDAERQAFEKQLQADQSLQQEVQLQKEIKKGLILLADKNRFREIHQELLDRNELPVFKTNASEEPKVISLHPAEPVKKINRWIPLATAAGLALLLGIGWFYLQPNRQASSGASPSEQLASRYLTDSVKSAPVLPYDPDRLGAGGIDEAAQNDSIQLQQAVTLLRQNQTRQAITKLHSLTEEVHNHWDAVAQWYLTLAYFKNSQPDQARKLLGEIEKTNGHPYQAEARQLLADLSKNEVN